MAASTVFLGIQGYVVGLDRATGQKLWETRLKGSDFVNVMLDGDRVLAATKGEIFCLDPATGRVLWNNKLPGKGTGLVTIATASGASNPMPAFREKKKRDETDATAGVIAVT